MLPGLILAQTPNSLILTTMEYIIIGKCDECAGAAADGRDYDDAYQLGSGGEP